MIADARWPATHWRLPTTTMERKISRRRSRTNHAVICSLRDLKKAGGKDNSEIGTAKVNGEGREGRNQRSAAFAEAPLLTSLRIKLRRVEKLRRARGLHLR